MFDFSVVTNWVNDLLTSVMPQWLATTIECVIVGALLLLGYTVLAMFYIMYERWVCAWFQCRRGPLRVGPWGLLQIFADVIKMLIKEVIDLWKSDKFLHKLAPYFVLVASVVVFACLPWGKGLQAIDFNIGIFFMTAVSSL
ncbi:MAG: NADH-quinone oxidoreductase subunit H, partial [Muribaculaceae bacterium]|nr:NADH-quinone oxidoreductase subunit H [Muribaculaceae bacterium]